MHFRDDEQIQKKRVTSISVSDSVVVIPLMAVVTIIGAYGLLIYP